MHHFAANVRSQAAHVPSLMTAAQISLHITFANSPLRTSISDSSLPSSLSRAADSSGTAESHPSSQLGGYAPVLSRSSGDQSVIVNVLKSSTAFLACEANLFSPTLSIKVAGGADSAKKSATGAAFFVRILRIDG